MDGRVIGRASPRGEGITRTLDRLATVPDADRHAPPSTPLPTGEWGRPPRPEPVSAERPPARDRLQRRRFSAPPPPPPGVGTPAPAPLTWRRIRTVAAELVIAAVVIGAVALFAGGSSPVHPGDAQSRWSSRALPALTRLVSDLAALGSDTASGSPAARRIAGDSATLRSDLGSATSIGPPPAPTLRSGWAATLAHVGTVVTTSTAVVAAGAGPAYDARLPAMRSAIAAAGDALLRFAGRLRAAP